MEYQSKILERIRQSVLSSGNNQKSQIHLPPLLKNSENKASSFAAISKMATSQISQITKSRMKTYERQSYGQKVRDKIRLLQKDEYKYLQTGEIYKEYRMLKEELKNMSEQLNRCISLKNFNHTMKSSPSENGSFIKSRCLDSSQSPNHFESIQEGFQKNNQKILRNSSMELANIMQKSGHILQNDPVELKQQLRQKIISAREELNKEKRNCKQLTLQSQKVGNEILNTDKMVQEMRLLQDELNILLLRKKKLEERVQVNKIRREKVENGQAQIYEKQYELQEFQETKKQKNIQAKTQQQLCSDWAKRQRTIAALKKDIQAKNKIKAKQYYDLLTELNKIQQNQSTLNTRFDKLQISIQLTKQQYSQLEEKQQPGKSRVQRPRLLKDVSNNGDKSNDTRSSFYKSKRNLDTNEVQPKDMLKEIEEHLSQTHKKLQDLEKKSPTIKNLQNSKSKQQLFQEQISAFDIDKQNHPSAHSSHSLKKQPTNLSHKVQPHSKKYQQLSDSQILEQQQEDIADESTKRCPQKIIQDIQLAEQIQVDEQIQV